MNAPTIYLRTLSLPLDLQFAQTRFDADWNSLATVSGQDLEARVREHGWRCLWLAERLSKRAFGWTNRSARANALQAALDGVPRLFNAAEIDSVCVTRYPGFSVAKLVMHARHIQREAPFHE